MGRRATTAKSTVGNKKVRASRAGRLIRNMPYAALYRRGVLQENKIRLKGPLGGPRADRARVQEIHMIRVYTPIMTHPRTPLGGRYTAATAGSHVVYYYSIVALVYTYIYIYLLVANSLREKTVRICSITPSLTLQR